jgi:nitroimidazol reductase NimA-like FMN-containing flavoprotein (pyridoxamine 5'-phosphate oxidase superfamily)
VLPTAVVRDGDRVLAHGSTGSRWLRHLAAGAPACPAVTAFDALVAARSAFESSMRYRSAVLSGQCQAVTEQDAKRRALDTITDALIPGRSAEARASTAKELAAVPVLALPIAEWSLKVPEGWPDDPPDGHSRPSLGRGAARGETLRSTARRAGSARWHTTACLGTAPAHQLIALACTPDRDRVQRLVLTFGNRRCLHAPRAAPPCGATDDSWMITSRGAQIWTICICLAEQDGTARTANIRRYGPLVGRV